MNLKNEQINGRFCMTKEEYLNMYKEDKLAEICEQLDSENDDLMAQIAELGDCVGELNKKCEELDVWDDSEKLFEKLKSIPAKDFIKLYYQMKEVIENKETNKNITYIPDHDNWGSITTAISSR